MTEKERKYLENQRPELNFIQDDILELWVSKFGYDIFHNWSMDAVANIFNAQLMRVNGTLIDTLRKLESRI